MRKQSSRLERARRYLDLFGPRKRHSWVGEGRAMVEHRAVWGEELERLAAAVDELGRELEGLGRVALNQHARRVVFAYDRAGPSPEALVALVEEAERRAGVENAPFEDAERGVPGDEEPRRQLRLELGADALGLALGLVLALTPVPAFGAAVNGAAVLSLIRHVPKLRRRLEKRFGRARTLLALDLAVALAQGLAQRPLASLVDLVHKATLLRESEARLRAWQARQTEFCVGSTPAGGSGSSPPIRPVPLPEGPIEAHVDRVWAISLGGFALSLVTTRSVQRAAAALFGALPKPARLGREVFAAELGRVLAQRGTVTLEPDALRLLDRVDCLVIEGQVASSRRFALGGLAAASAVEPAEARARAALLFDPEHALEVRGSGRWALGPLGMLVADLSEDLAERAARLEDEGAVVLGLVHDDVVLGLGELSVVARTGVEELVSAAHAAQMHVVVAAPGGQLDDAVFEGLNADEVIPDGRGLPGGIRQLQRDGRVVCLVAAGGSPGLEVADFSIGLPEDGTPPPWGAHVVCRQDLSEVRFLIHAAEAARRVSKGSVNLALGAAAMAVLASTGRLIPMTPTRAMAMVNGAALVSMLSGGRSSRKLRRLALPPPRDPTPWHALSPRGALARLRSSDQGLAAREARGRIEPPEPSPSALGELGEAVTDELWNPLTPLLAAGAALSALVGSTADAGVVAAAVGANALVGGAQRFRAARAIRTLSRSSRRKVSVRRSGRVGLIGLAELVRGDVVLLSPGEVVPADCRILEAEGLEVDASSLTGESLPVLKGEAPSFELQMPDRSSMLYEGTSIAAGRATAVVVAVGRATEASRGADVARGDAAQGGVERRLRSLMKLTTPVALGAGVGVVGVGLLRGRRLEDLVGSAVSLAVAAVPEGLPLLATAAQLSSAARLSRRGVLVRNPRSIEALGRVDVICLDKTGTLTEGRIELHSVHDGRTAERVPALSTARLVVLAAALRASPAACGRAVQVDPTEEALLRGAAAAGARAEMDVPGWQRISELPFEAARSYHATLARTLDRARLSLKGAPEVVVRACSLAVGPDGASPIDDTGRRRLLAEAARLGGAGLRVLAVAERSASLAELDPFHPESLTFKGFVAFSDPVRPSSIEALAGLGRAGISVVMLTGDHPATAAAIADELGMACEGRVVTGAELATKSDDEVEALVVRTCVFARVTPSQKVRVVRALQRAGHVVAMAGDGSNDAPAIRLANVGLAIGERSTAAARGAADIVITDERIETIVRAVVEGRAMWASVRDAVSILLGGNLGEIGFTLAAGLADGRPPLHARQLLLVNLLTDVAPAMAVALHPPTRSAIRALATEGPEVSLGQPLTRDIAVRAATTAAGAGAAWLAGVLTGSPARARTIGLAALVGTQLGQTLVSGGSSLPVIATSVGSALALFGIIQIPGLSRFFGCQPLGPVGWLTAAGASAGATGLGWALVTRTGDGRPAPTTAEVGRLPPGEDNAVACKG